MTHSIPSGVANSTVEHCINEYVRLIRDRNILTDHWFGGLSFISLAEKYDLSLPAVKAIVYNVGDSVLRRAQELDHNIF